MNWKAGSVEKKPHHKKSLVTSVQVRIKVVVVILRLFECFSKDWMYLFFDKTK